MEAETQVRSIVEARTSLSTSVLYREMNEGRFPRPIRKSPGRVVWVKSEVDCWLAERIAERDARMAAEAVRRQNRARRAASAA